MVEFLLEKKKEDIINVKKYAIQNPLAHTFIIYNQHEGLKMLKTSTPQSMELNHNSSALGVRNFVFHSLHFTTEVYNLHSH